MILYGDILFLVNFSMDYLTLYVCAFLCHRKIRCLRLLPASLVGGIGGVLMTVYGISGVWGLLGSLALSALMTMIAFGGGGTIAAFLRWWALVWGCGAVSGGIMSLLLSLGQPVYIQSETRKRGFFPLFLCTAALTLLFVRAFRRKNMVETVEICICNGSASVVLSALVDTGNLLSDPISGSAVILVAGSAAPSLSLPQTPEEALTTHAYPIPARSIGGDTLLWAVRPSSVRINHVEKQALVAATAASATEYGGFPALCPGVLLDASIVGKQRKQGIH